jgi:hypothetical protein
VLPAVPEIPVAIVAVVSPLTYLVVDAAEAAITKKDMTTVRVKTMQSILLKFNFFI